MPGAWPNNPMDKHEPCGICEEDILIAAYDASRVKAYADTEKLGACHLECIAKLIAKQPEMLEDI